MHFKWLTAINTRLYYMDPYTIATSINDNNDDYDGDYYHFAHNNIDNGYI